MKSIRVLCLILALMLTVVGCERKLTKSLKLGHDIAITGISVLSRSVRDYTVPVVVNIENQGDCGESFDVKLIDVTDGKEIGTKSVTLPAPGGGGIDEMCDLILTGETGGKQYFGDWLAVGDVNGDGYDDLLVSAVFYNDEQGRVYLYYGGKSMDENADRTFTGENIGDRFGSGGGYLADLNKDGFDDVIVGARYFDNGRGRVYIYWGGPDMDKKADITLEAEAGLTDCNFGRGITAGDVNGDGHTDLIVTAIKYQNYRGRVYLYYGPIASDTAADKTFTGEKTDDTFGCVLATGDVDGDNCDDLLIGTHYFNYPANDGRVYLYYGDLGTTMNEECDLVFNNENPGSEFGSGIDLFDVDNDGHADVIIGARKYGASNDGRAYLYWGNDRKNMDDEADLFFEGEAGESLHFGGFTVVCGYANNDNYGDIIINAYKRKQSRAYLYYGNAKTSMDTICDHIFSGEKAQCKPHGTRIGDFNGDSYGDVVMGGNEYNNFQGRCCLWYGGPGSSTDITFYWDTTKVSKGKHSLKAKVGPVAGEKDTADNTVTTEVSVKTP
ncbi:FG-GAP repeat protein [bacterium]|nr:FG-GAP repeat protein [bacterium]